MARRRGLSGQAGAGQARTVLLPGQAGAGRGMPGQARSSQGRPGQAEAGLVPPGQAKAGPGRPGPVGAGLGTPGQARAASQGRPRQTHPVLQGHQGSPTTTTYTTYRSRALGNALTSPRPSLGSSMLATLGNPPDVFGHPTAHHLAHCSGFQSSPPISPPTHHHHHPPPASWAARNPRPGVEEAPLPGGQAPAWWRRPGMYGAHWPGPPRAGKDKQSSRLTQRRGPPLDGWRERRRMVLRTRSGEEERLNARGTKSGKDPTAAAAYPGCSGVCLRYSETRTAPITGVQVIISETAFTWAGPGQARGRTGAGPGQDLAWAGPGQALAWAGPGQDPGRA
eukprot:gene16791-biopygen10620